MEKMKLGFAALVMLASASSAWAQDADYQQELQQDLQREALGGVQSGDSTSNPMADLQNLQGMVAQFQNIQSCMKQKDPRGFADMNRQGYAVQQQVAALCKAGKKQKAQETSMQFMNDFHASKSYQTLTVCAPPAYVQMAENMLFQGNGGQAVAVCDHIGTVQQYNH